jgi:HlyD family secretion protein
MSTLITRIKHVLDAAPTHAPSLDDPTERWVQLGRKTVVWMCGGLLLVSMVFSINGAVVASGTVNVESNYKAVQHLDGGIVQNILVKNGDRVQEGDVLVRLDDTGTRSSLGVTMSRLYDLWIQQARLEAERDRKDVLALPESVLAREKDPAVAASKAAQLALFEARLTARLGEQSMLTQRVEQVRGEITGLEAQLAGRRKEAEINQQELATLKPLFAKGYVSQQRMAPLHREAARLEGEIGRLSAEISRGKGALAEAQLKLAQSEKDFTQQVVDELRKVQAAVNELEESRRAQKDKVERTEIRAPRSGRVHALAVHTEGGVIAPGMTLMQIIPEGEQLVVDAQLPPAEIDKVRQGLNAGVRFPAFSARVTPRIEGKVAKVSPAQITDSQGRSYFTAQIEVPQSELKKLGRGHQLVPGMPAEVFIETSSRSILSYFLKPLTDALSHAFRES